MHKEDAGYECRGRGERAVLQPCAVTTVARSREWRQVPVGECLRKCLVLPDCLAPFPCVYTYKQVLSHDCPSCDRV